VADYHNRCMVADYIYADNSNVFIESQRVSASPRESP
jgi:hypothetical protein